MTSKNERESWLLSEVLSLCRLFRFPGSRALVNNARESRRESEGAVLGPGSPLLKHLRVETSAAACTGMMRDGGIQQQQAEWLAR